MLLTREDKDAIKLVKEQLKGRFEIKNLGKVDHLLGIQIQRHKGRAILIN